jgi:hypothetical protein
MSERDPKPFGAIATISWFYLAFGLVFLALCFARVEIRGIKLGPSDTIVPAFIAIAAIGTLLKKN